MINYFAQFVIFKGKNVYTFYLARNPGHVCSIFSFLYMSDGFIEPARPTALWQRQLRVPLHC